MIKDEVLKVDGKKPICGDFEYLSVSEKSGQDYESKAKKEELQK